MKVLTDREVLDFMEKHKDTPGIVQGFLQEHQRRGGKVPHKRDPLGGFGDIFGDIFGKGAGR